ncbi:hypothetical protein [Candidatus Chlamydia sanziniae]|uniref:hypothetical protein n=1 Tax=Candidatus Chlamydia sanziniae TaxID=1806891 RepID=UPI000ADC9A6B|nr:hypothetical protein [Candidatus Chlamydia sanziniae]
MKSYLPWIFISSVIVSSHSFSSLATVVEESLGPTHSFNQETNSTTFSPKNTSTGVIYTLTGDVYFMNLGKTTPLTNGCLSDSAEGLTFIGNGYSLLFSNIASSATGAAISVSTADKNIAVSGFSKISFLQSPSTIGSSPSGKGATKCGGNLTFKNNVDIVFFQNFSSEDGGAINTKKLSLTGSQGSITFAENKATTAKKGGAIHASETIDISSNSGSLIFKGNTSEEGGAIASTGISSLKDNQHILFSNNNVTGTTGKGGAISCGDTSDLVCTGNGTVVFMNNSAIVSGGAVHAKKVLLSSGGGGGSSLLTTLFPIQPRVKAEQLL